MGAHAEGREEEVKRWVALNEYGRPIGQNHHRAHVPDETIDLIREMREDQHLSYGQIAKELGLKRSYVQKVANYEIRAQQPHGGHKLQQDRSSSAKEDRPAT